MFSVAQQPKGPISSLGYGDNAGPGRPHATRCTSPADSLASSRPLAITFPAAGGRELSTCRNTTTGSANRATRPADLVGCMQLSLAGAGIQGTTLPGSDTALTLIAGIGAIGPQAP